MRCTFRDLDPGAISGDDDIFGEDLGESLEREIQILDSTEKRGIVGCPERGDECREFPNKPPHLAVGHPQEDVDAGHPRNE